MDIQEVYGIMQSTDIELGKLIIQEMVIKEQLENSPLYKELQDIRNKLKVATDIIENNKNEIKELMLKNDLKKLEFGDKTFTVKKSPGSVNIIDECLIPNIYFTEKIVKSVDKKKVKEDLETSIVPGTEIVYSYSLIIIDKTL